MEGRGNLPLMHVDRSGCGNGTVLFVGTLVETVLDAKVGAIVGTRAVAVVEQMGKRN